MNEPGIINDQFGEEQCDMLFDSDNMGRITMVRFFNQSLAQRLGYTESELIGKNIVDFLIDAKSVAGAEHFGRLYASETAFHAKSRKLVMKNGETVIAESYLMPMYDPAGKMIGHRGMEFFALEEKTVA
jgi:PAS domain S-box-containing protein